MNEDALNYFFKGYFHQDWFAEYGVFENAVRDFCDHESATRIVSVICLKSEETVLRYRN